MTTLNRLQDVTRQRKARKLLGRGPGSGKGKTCGRGQKGAGARSGYKRRWGYEGGQMRLFMKLPERGFSNVRFQKRLHIVNLTQIEKAFSDGEVVNLKNLRERGLVNGESNGVKILGNGELTKKVKIQVDAVSEGAKEKLKKAKAEIVEVKE